MWRWSVIALLLSINGVEGLVYGYQHKFNLYQLSYIVFDIYRIGSSMWVYFCNMFLKVKVKREIEEREKKSVIFLIKIMICFLFVFNKGGSDLFFFFFL